MELTQAQVRELFASPPRGMTPLTEERKREIYQQVQTEVAQLEEEGRYTFAGWFPVAVRLIEAAHGIGIPPTGSQGTGRDGGEG
jgi:hypothetical protein